MPPKTITITCTKKKFRSNYFYSKQGSITRSIPEIYELIRSGTDIKFENLDEDALYLSLLHYIENGSTKDKINFHKKGDKDLLTRVIRHGGFTQYIKELENGKVY